MKEYATYEDNLRLQNELNIEKEDLLAQKEELEQSRQDIEEMLNSDELSDEQREEYTQNLELLEQQDSALDARLQDNEIQMNLLKVEEQEMRQISFVEVSDVPSNVEQIMDDFDSNTENVEDALKGQDSEGFLDQSEQTIGKLQEQEEIVKSAAELKFQEIYEYVANNNMDHYDTTHDPYYQHLISEYRFLKSQEEDIRSHINGIDSDAMMVSYYQDIPYDSKANQEIEHAFHTSVYSEQELKEIEKADEEIAEKEQDRLLEEIEKGVDDPEKTDYFVDKIRATKVLEKFVQSKWEKLDISERKQHIENLAKYNYDILGITDAPEIEYYERDDSRESGYYDDETNRIYINASNLEDGKETADTIAHEIRHVYQYRRADKCETARDIEFAENLAPGGYIEPKSGELYFAQLVERDAFAYGNRFKEFISLMDGEDSPKSEIPLEASEKKNDESNYGKSSVKKVSREHYERNQLRETFDVFEIAKIKENVEPRYKNALLIGEKNPALEMYKEHYDLEHGHIEKVVEKTCETAKCLEKVFQQKDYNGIYSSKISYKTLQMMAYYHDTGMDGCISASDYETEKKNYVEAKKEILSKEKAEKEYEESFREKHSLNSALHVLEDRDKIEAMGVDADVVAIGCLIHSKKCSGIGNLAEGNGTWEVKLDQIQAAVDEYNMKYPDRQIEFNKSCICDASGKISDEKLAQMRTYGACIRLGDAEAHDYQSEKTQSGHEIKIKDDPLDVNPLLTRKKVLKEKQRQRMQEVHHPEMKEDFYQELQSIEVYVGDKQLTNKNDPSGISRMYALGEKNFKELKTDTEEIEGQIVPVLSIELVDGNNTIFCTQRCIEERVKEMASIGAGPLKEDQSLNGADKIDMKMVVHIGKNCSEDTKKMYERYAQKTRNRWNIEMEIAE